MEHLIKKIKDYMENIDNKKLINKLFIPLVFSVLILILINGFTSPNKKDKSPVIKDRKDEYNKVVQSDYSKILEDKLVNILSKLKGVGEVHVMITLEDSLEKVPAINTTKTVETTNETDSGGGEREIKREDETRQLLNLSNEVVILKELQPNIKGVIVIAEGAEEGVVLENIYEAVKTVLGISTNRIQVFSSK